jgi:hypothetical protein
MEGLGVQVRTDLAEWPGELSVGASVDEGAACVGGFKAHDQAHRRGFSRTVRAEEAGDLAGAHLEGEIIEGCRSAVPFGQSLHLDHESASSTGFSCRLER